MNPITKAHLEGVEEYLTSAWHEISCPAHSNQMQSEDDCNCLYKFNLDFLTTYATNLLKAAKEAGPEKEEPWPNPDNEFQRGHEAGHEACRTSFHSAIDEGIKEIRKGEV